jgi:hypothetical protein
MRNRIPHFTFSPPDTSNDYAAFIEMDGQPVHRIKNLDAFYQGFGYTVAMSKAGVQPDEFVKSAYTNGNLSHYSICFQMHLIDYLAKNSDEFMGEYGYQYNAWLDEHIEAATGGNFSRPPCRTSTFCNIGMSGFKCQRIEGHDQ